MGRRSLPTDDMNLTEREHRMLDYLKDTITQKGYPPTVREICSFIGVKSTSTVHKDLASLQAKGYIAKDPAKPRTIEIIGFNGPTAAGTHAGRTAGFRSGAADGQPGDRDLSVPGRVDIVDIPLVGRVAAGTPILAEQNISDFFPVPARFVTGTSDHFMLTVSGESMIEAGIMDGDYILVRQQSTARNGDMVVAMIDGFESEATVKTFYRENDHIRLQPENSTMSPIIVRDVKILGIVKGVFRYL